MKKILIILLLPFYIVCGQNSYSPSATFYPLSLSSSKQTDCFSNPSKFRFSLSDSKFFNNNVGFDDFKSSLRSAAKISAEAVTGAAVGLGLGLLMYNLTKPSPEKEENFLGIFFNAAITGIGGIAGSNLGVISLGNLLGDNGSIKNTFYWSIIGGGIFALISNVVTNNKDTRFWITAVGIPIGASIGFNSNNLIGW